MFCIYGLVQKYGKEDTPHYAKDSTYEKIECAFDESPKYGMKILLRDLSDKVGRKYNFNRLSSHLLSGNERNRTCKTVGLRMVLYWSKTWYLTLREERRLRGSTCITNGKRLMNIGYWWQSQVG
jgi:hypothetical protein